MSVRAVQLAFAVFIGLAVSSRVSAAASCTLSTTSPSVTVCAPTANGLVQSPVHVVAGTTDSHTVTAVQIYVDNKLTQQVNA
ncbi:MAG TPA: Ig-like domain-containing protein, partial [Terriglobales bacterium]|nr:Ig-like domain-containing protein [Terriglobales bacterium]